MVDPLASPRLRYLEWIEEQIEEHKASLTREELLTLADEAVEELFAAHDGQYPLTEILLRDAVDALILERLRLPSFRRLQLAYQSDTTI
jgi:hypothetical protein